MHFWKADLHSKYENIEVLWENLLEGSDWLKFNFIITFATMSLFLAKFLEYVCICKSVYRCNTFAQFLTFVFAPPMQNAIAESVSQRLIHQNAMIRK